MDRSKWSVHYFYFTDLTSIPNPIINTNMDVIEPMNGIKLINAKTIVIPDSFIILLRKDSSESFLLIRDAILITKIDFASIKNKM